MLHRDGRGTERQDHPLPVDGARDAPRRVGIVIDLEDGIPRRGADLIDHAGDPVGCPLDLLEVRLDQEV